MQLERTGSEEPRGLKNVPFTPAGMERSVRYNEKSGLLSRSYMQYGAGRIKKKRTEKIKSRAYFPLTLFLVEWILKLLMFTMRIRFFFIGQIYQIINACFVK
jgi:hypothetical protein